MMRTNNGCAEKLLSESVLLTMTLSLRERRREPLQGAFRASHKRPYWKMLAPEEKNNIIFLHDCGKMHSSINNERIGKRSCGSEKVNALKQWEVITKHSVGKSILYFARYYDPVTFRMLSQDTYRGEKTDPKAWNLYVYCANNPINYTDPSGHKRVSRNSRGAINSANKGIVAHGIQINGSAFAYWNIGAVGFGFEIIWPNTGNRKPRVFRIFHAGYSFPSKLRKYISTIRRGKIPKGVTGAYFKVATKGKYRFEDKKYLDGATWQISVNYRWGYMYVASNKYYIMQGVGVGKSLKSIAGGAAFTKQLL